MGRKCIVCHKKEEDHHGHFHRIPNDPVLCKMWITTLNLSATKKSDRVCSSHFHSSDYWPGREHGKPLLKPKAVPLLGVYKEQTSLSTEDENLPLKIVESGETKQDAAINSNREDLTRVSSDVEMDLREADDVVESDTPDVDTGVSFENQDTPPECLTKKAQEAMTQQQLSYQAKKIKYLEDSLRHLRVRVNKQEVQMKKMQQQLDETAQLRDLLKLISQDHVETFFSSIRSSGGFKNNPSCIQFQSASKKLLVRHETAAARYGNCSILNAVDILPVQPSQNDIIASLETPPDKLHLDQDYINSVLDLNRTQEDISDHIGGFVIRKIKKKLICKECLQHLEKNTVTNRLVEIKSRGGLINPSSDVTFICTWVELVVWQYSGYIFSNDIKKIIHNNVKQLVYDRVFFSSTTTQQ